MSSWKEMKDESYFKLQCTGLIGAAGGGTTNCPKQVSRREKQQSMVPGGGIAGVLFTPDSK